MTVNLQDAYIDLGFTDGVVKGLQFDVYLVKDISGIYGTHVLPISICVPVIRSNSRLYLVIRFSSNTFSSIPTFSGL